MLRIGQGFDVHAFADDGDHVMLGGVRVPHERGLEAHSDGDLLLHALTDALLGALALGDIGHYFPDTDHAFKNADSAFLLTHVWKDVSARGFCLGNADITLIGERPKLAPYVPTIKKRIARLLDCTAEQVSVKATTTEKMGFCGRREGLAAQAVVLLEARRPDESRLAEDGHDD